MNILAEPVHTFRRRLMERFGFRPRTSFGLDKLDIKLLEYISLRKGVFVEAGGNDGLAQSNTAYFERYRGWRGILIEPIPDLAAACRRNRPRARVEQCALVPFDYSAPTVEMTYCNLMSLVRGARGSAQEDTAHLDRGRQYLKPDEEVYTVSVPARTLTNVLESCNITRFDLLSLDVEGFEGEVLRGLDFGRYCPTFILVEANNPNQVHAILEPRYDLKATLSHHDRLYVRRESPP
jgi:FkbM family methyltransferase